jgi:hypothetical protein
MLLPDVSPSRDDCVAAVAAALLASKGRIYLDANVLIHCYEMNFAASDDMLKALEAYGPRVRVPAWAAKETWDYTTRRTSKRPLRPLSDKLRSDLQRFQKESTRYIDDGAVKGSTKDEFQQDLAEAVGGLVDLFKLVQDHEPKADQTTARLMPFIDEHRVPSDLTAILDEVTRTAATRMVHGIPPGFADWQPPSEEVDDDGRQSAKPRGKQKNPHGDLIIWLEILQDCNREGAEQLVLVTRDTTKNDWVYVPKKIRNEKGQPLDNHGLVTLPLPLLVHEAQQKCPAIKGVYVITVEMLAHVLLSLKVDVTALAAALQAETEEASAENVAEVADTPRAAATDEDYVAEFDSQDMTAELSDDDAVDRRIQELSGEGWKAQNQAARHLEPLLPSTNRIQRVQIGRFLVEAANDGALAPAEFLSRVLADESLARSVRSDLLIGVLAAIYIDESGVPQKPVAARGITEVIFRHQATAVLAGAYEAVMSRLKSQSRKYLALPGEQSQQIPLSIALENGVLRGATAGNASLLEEDAPANRAIQRTGRSITMSTDDLVELLATEFVIPKPLLIADQASAASFEVPELIGFISWGPNTGTLLR